MADEAGFEKALQLDVRKRIYTEIERSPGLHFREIQRRTTLAVGSLQYHLDYLQKHHIIRTQKEGKFVRYYSVRGAQVGDTSTINMGQNTMASLRHESTRKIVLFLLTENRANNERIAQEIGLSPSTTSWHLDKLVESGVLKKERAGRKSFFTLTNPNEARKLLINFKQSFFDQAVDNFVELTESLAESPPPANEGSELNQNQTPNT